MTPAVRINLVSALCGSLCALAYALGALLHP